MNLPSTFQFVSCIFFLINIVCIKTNNTAASNRHHHHHLESIMLESVLLALSISYSELLLLLRYRF